MAKPFILAMFAAFALTVPAAAQNSPLDRSLVIAATTSIEDSGLFEHLVPRFEAARGISIRTISRASATALMTAERGTIDAVIVNDPEALDRFAAAGEGTRRYRLMANRFVIVGPPSDPASIRGMTEAAAALREIARKRAPFVSRGDNSGTYVAEQRLCRPQVSIPRHAVAAGTARPDSAWALPCRWRRVSAPTR